MEPQTGEGQNVTPITPNTEVKESFLAPACKVTSFSKILAAVLFIVLPFVGFYMGYTTAHQPVPVADVFTVPPETVDSAAVSETGSNVAVRNDVVVFAVQESEVSGSNRTVPVMGLYKQETDKVPVKFASVGAANEYPIQFAASPNRQKVAVNLESKLVLIDVVTGQQETIFTPKFVVGGKITFSPDGNKLAFVDGNYYVPTDYVTLYTYDLISKQLTSHIQNSDMKFVDVDAWRADNTLVLSAGAPKGCATASYVLYDLASGVLTLDSVPDFSRRSSDGSYVVIPTKTETPDACLNVGNMCSYAYDASMSYRIYDPLTNVVLGEFEQDQARVEFVALSLNNNSVLYKVLPWPSKEAQCDDMVSGAEYFIKNFSDGQIEPVTDIEEKLAEWGIAVHTWSSNKTILTPSYTVSE
jgi:dipeptidyl aminopeptidase/acylaminoacyl peptidase